MGHTWDKKKTSSSCEVGEFAEEYLENLPLPIV